MIGTIETKKAQLTHGYYRTGDGPEKLLLTGSCRSIPYLNYLDIWNNRHGRFTVTFIDPFYWNWNQQDEMVPYEPVINSLETNRVILDLLASTNIYIHEFYRNYGMFNSSRDNPKNIYQFGLNPQLEVCIPNFADYYVLGQPKEEGLANLERFYAVCRLSSIPEMEEYFKEHWRSKRFFWSGNHITKEFTLFIFRMMDEKFLKLGHDAWFWEEIQKHDMYSGNPQPVTAEDITNYDLKWT